MARKFKTKQASKQNILLVDDDLDYLQASQRLLSREGYTVISAENGPQALEILQNQHVDLLLLDYFMPGMTGEEMVTELRKFNPLVQVVLQTGYASEKPPRDLLRRLDIQGYYDKSDGPDKFLLWTDVGLKAADTVQFLQKSRQGLQYILNVTPDLHSFKPLDDLLQGVLEKVAGLLGAVNSFLATLPDGGVAEVEPVETESILALRDEADFIVRASTGRFEKDQNLSVILDDQTLVEVQDTLNEGGIKRLEGSTVIPLKVGEISLGVIYLERPAVQEKEVELLQLLANQASVAIRNSQLYEMATLDTLTGVFVRGFFDKMMLRELRSAFRAQQTLSFLFIDIDNMKQINDQAGHIAGDQALEIVGKVLRGITRGSDIVGRYGGDEFAIALPHTPAEGGRRAGERVLEGMADKTVKGPDGPMPLQVSIGVCTLEPHNLDANEITRPLTQEYFTSMFQNVVKTADDAVYKAKQSGGNQYHLGAEVTWHAFDGGSRE